MISVFLFVLFLCWYWWCNKSSPVLSLPLVGMLPRFLWQILLYPSSYHDFLTYLLQKSGGTYVFKGPGFGGSDFVMTCDPSNLRHILSNNITNYHKGLDFKEIFDALGDGIFNSSGDWWRIQRRLLQKLMNHGSLMPTMELIVQKKTFEGLFCVLDHASRLGTQVDMEDILRRCFFDITSQFILGYDPKCLSIEFPQNAFRQAFDDTEEAIFYRHFVPVSVWKLQRWLQLGTEKKMEKSLEVANSIMYEEISRKKETLNKSANTNLETEDFDVLSYFLTEVDNVVHGTGEVNGDINVKSNKFLRDTTATLLSAGSDTTAVGLSWLLWRFTTHPLVEKKILEEIRQNLPAEGHKVFKCFGFKETSKLTYLHAAVLEALRLYPPLPYNHVDSIGPDVVPSGLHVDRNTRIVYSMYAMARMKEVWGEDCLEFKPERWISEKGEINRASPFKFTVFNAGPRTCLGKDISLVQMKAIAASLIWNYRFQVAENHIVCPSTSMILHMRNDLKVTVTKRSSVPLLES